MLSQRVSVFSFRLLLNCPLKQTCTASRSHQQHGRFDLFQSICWLQEFGWEQTCPQNHNQCKCISFPILALPSDRKTTGWDTLSQRQLGFRELWGGERARCCLCTTYLGIKAVFISLYCWTAWRCKQAFREFVQTSEENKLFSGALEVPAGTRTVAVLLQSKFDSTLKQVPHRS